MIDETIRDSTRHCGRDLPLELAIDPEPGDGNPDNLDLVAIERTWSERLQFFELQLEGHTLELNHPTLPEPPKHSPLERWYSEPTIDGFFHNIGEVRMLPKRPNVYLNSRRHPQIHDKMFSTYGDDSDSIAGATCGFLSEISRGLSRL